VDRDTEAAAERASAAAQVFVADPGAPLLDDDAARHLSRVLRLRAGEPVVAADGHGTWRLCRFTGAADLAAGLEVDGPPRHDDPPGLPLTVAFAPAKGDRPEWVVQKLTELGIDRIVPLAAEHSVVRWDEDRAVRAIERLRRVAREAAAQSRRTWLPEVAGVSTVAELAEAHATGGQPLRLAQLGGGAARAGDDAVAVGPEGGWSQDEAMLGGPHLGLGPTVLRAETAAVAAGVLLSALRAGTVEAATAR
jgi:16S rRNA (uracil1498-N3)-methyltransferase